MSPFIRYSLPAAALLAAQAFSPAFGALGDKQFNFDTAQDLVDVCASDDVAAGFACRAFIEATVQYHDAVSDRKKMKRLVCYPQGATIAQGREVFLAWAQKSAGNATRMKELPVVALVRSLAAAYPCK